MVFHWSLSDNKSPQVSRTLLSILAVLNNAVIWMVSTRPPTPSPLVPFSNYYYYYYYYYYYCYTPLRAFHPSVRQWFSTGVWVTASLLKSPVLLSGFWSILKLLSFGWWVLGNTVYSLITIAPRSTLARSGSTW